MPKPALPFQAQSAETLLAWLKTQITSLGLNAPISIYALVDVAKLSKDQLAAPIADLNTPDHEALNLYEDLEGLEIVRTGPLLIELTEATLAKAVSLSFETHAVSFLLGVVNAGMLAQHLQSLREVTLPDDTQALFRFQDVNVSSNLMAHLSPGMVNQMLGPLLRWVAPDVCGFLHVLAHKPGYQRLGPLRFDRRTFDRLNEALLTFTVADQVRAVDPTLLQDLSACQSTRVINQRLAAGKKLGLKVSADLGLYVVLSLQLPPGFERQAPFAGALQKALQGHSTFGDALDAVPQTDWDKWNAEHAS